MISLISISQPGFAQQADTTSQPGQELLTAKPEQVVSSHALKSSPRHFVQDMAQRGITFQGMFVNDWSKDVPDSGRSSGGFGRYSFDFSGTLDGEKLLGWSGATGFARLKNHINEFGSAYEAAAQVPSNIDADSKTSLYELWIQQTMLSNKLRLKFGKIDANTEFDVVQGAGDFLNSSMGYSPTIMAFPSYPDPKLALGIFYQPKQNYQLGLGVFQTAGGGILSIAEPGHNWEIGKNELPGRISAGYWRLDGNVNRFDGSKSSVTQGYYSVLEQGLWRHALNAEGGERKLSAFLQYGQSDGNVSPLSQHLGAGTVLQALFRGRTHDSIGVAATRVHFSSQPGSGFDGGSESIMEGYYKLAITKKIAFVQDFQFLRHPGGRRSNPDCLVITPRLVITL